MTVHQDPLHIGCQGNDHDGARPRDDDREPEVRRQAGVDRSPGLSAVVTPEHAEVELQEEAFRVVGVRHDTMHAPRNFGFRPAGLHVL